MPRRKTTIDRNPLERVARDTWTDSTQTREPDEVAAPQRSTGPASTQPDRVSEAVREAQDAALAASLSVFEAGQAFNRAALVAWSEAWYQAQKLALLALGGP